MSQDALRRRAREALADGAERAPARAHFRALGIDPGRLDGAIVGVASTWTGTMPCNLNHLALRLGGTITGEHGIGWLKRGQLERQLGPLGYDLHLRIKQAFDPKNLLNPGKKR